MDYRLVFSAAVPSRDATVFLLTDDVSVPVPMAFTVIDPLLQIPIFNGAHTITLSSFPRDLNYCYLIDDEVYTCSLRINLRPLSSTLNVFDVLVERSPKVHPNTFAVTFRIFKPVRHGSSVVLRPVTPVVPSTRFEMAREGDFWTVTVDLPCTSTIFVYKYSIAPHNLPTDVSEYETGNAHTLFVCAPIGGTHITVYDPWHSSRIAFPYYGSHLQPLLQAPTETAYRLEIVAADFYEMLQASFSDLRGLELCLCPDGAWVVARQIPVNTPGFAFTVRSYDQETPLELAGARVFPGPRSAVILSRYAFGTAFRRAIGVYAPLVSLRATDADIVGDFSVLVAFAGWAKSYALHHVHVHLEWLALQQIDPVHAIVECRPRERTLHAVRESKIAALTAEYRVWAATESGRAEYEQFLTEFPWFLALEDFGRWVQWRLWQQLSDAYFQVLNLGDIRLMIDVPVDAADHWPAKLVTASRYAQIIRVVSFENALLGPFNVQAVREALPAPGAADLFLTRFCTVTDTWARFNSWIVDRPLVSEILGRLAPEEQKAQSAALDRLILQAMDGPMEIMHQVAGDSSATFVLEARLAEWLNRLQVPQVAWERLGMVPATENPTTPAPSFLMPRALSPEQISEFPETMTQGEIMDEMKLRAHSVSPAVTVYLQDLLLVARRMERARPEKLQEIEGHCRFTFPHTLADLRANEEVSRRVQVLVRKSKRTS
jgi:hypothetical protein